MNGVTDPSETYFKQGLWAYDANAKAWVKLEVDASGYLQVTGLTLPPGAATSAHQVTQNTALELIDDLYNALHSVGTDELDVIVESSVLPTDAATAAHQVTAQTTLDALVDVRHALHTVAMDELDVIFQGQDVDVEVKQQVPADLTAALHGYISAAWRKLPMLWGYSERINQTVENDTHAAGSLDVDGGQVSEGEVWVIQQICAISVADASARIIISVHDGTNNYNLLDATGTGAARWQIWIGEIVLKKDDLVRATFVGTGENDVCRLRYWGYRLDIDL